MVTGIDDLPVAEPSYPHELPRSDFEYQPPERLPAPEVRYITREHFNKQRRVIFVGGLTLSAVGVASVSFGENAGSVVLAYGLIHAIFSLVMTPERWRKTTDYMGMTEPQSNTRQQGSDTES